MRAARLGRIRAVTQLPTYPVGVTDQWFLVLGIALLAVAVGIWVWWIWGRLRRRRRLQTWPRVKAPLVEVWSTSERGTSGTHVHSQSYTLFHGRYEFDDASGQTQTGDYRSVKKKTARGDLVDVMYDPDRPARHEPTDPKSLGAGLFFVTLFSAGVLLFAVPAILLGLGFE